MTVHNLREFPADVLVRGDTLLRYYEEAGLITPVERRGGRRRYQPDLLTRPAFIALCQDMGFSIAEIATLLSAVERPAALAGAGRAHTRRHRVADATDVFGASG